MNNPIEVGRRIRTCREERGVTQDELGKALGLNKSTIQRYEAGKITRIKLPVLESIAEELNINPEYLALKCDNPTIYEVSDENLYASTDVMYELDGDSERIYEFQKAVDADRAAEQAVKERTEKLLKLFNQLNDLGKERVLEWVEELTEIEKYTDKRGEV
ncbi:MAG: helix-turn-helix domain-containing protein [Ruminococcus sp.]|nr:helix-turn-helix domain-containing protein [Ruminococcus sp.]